MFEKQTPHSSAAAAAEAVEDSASPMRRAGRETTSLKNNRRQEAAIAHTQTHLQIWTLFLHKLFQSLNVIHGENWHRGGYVIQSKQRRFVFEESQHVS
jgi:hypothetical protein